MTKKATTKKTMLKDPPPSMTRNRSKTRQKPKKIYSIHISVSPAGAIMGEISTQSINRKIGTVYGGSPAKVLMHMATSMAAAEAAEATAATSPTLDQNEIIPDPQNADDETRGGPK